MVKLSQHFITWYFHFRTTILELGHTTVTFALSKLLHETQLNSHDFLALLNSTHQVEKRNNLTSPIIYNYHKRKSTVTFLKTMHATHLSPDFLHILNKPLNNPFFNNPSLNSPPLNNLPPNNLPPNTHTRSE
eukprot:Phypoly_transcript_21719.p1 GENE.Phypoly_transcript_21719~~Phypoly_transcript_21719.p1  ORF type:complete len:132 (+),score=12.15 Phypoly_transcript_21719:239-634(+)